MSFFGDDTAKPRDDNGEPFLDAVISMTSNDSGTYVGAGALRNSDVFAAVNVIASDLASNPIEYADKATAKLLNKAPNNHMNAYSFRFALATTMLLNGNAFAKIVRNNSGQVSALDLIPNNCMVVKLDTATGAVSYNYTPPEGHSQRLKTADVLHFKAFTQDGYTGLSPLYSLRDEVAIQKTGNRMLRNFFNSGVLGSGILKVHKSDLGKDAKENIRKKFEAANSGNNALKTIVMDEGMDYTDLPVNTEIVKLVNSNDWSTKQIAKAFGLPTDKLGLESQHSNGTQANINYLQNTLVHYFACITSELDAKLSTGDKHFSFNTDRLFSADPTTMQDLAIKGLQSGLRTVNESREMAGLPPIDGGDVPIVMSNYVPLPAQLAINEPQGQINTQNNTQNNQGSVNNEQ